MKKRKFEFLLGMNRIVRPLYEGLKDYKEIEEYSEGSYFINKNFKPFILNDLNFRDIRGVDSKDVVDFVLNARINGFNQIQTRESIKNTLIQREEEEDFIIGERNGKIVAQACIQTYTPKINQIGGVYTVQDERNKGYCKAIVSEICRRIVERGKLPTLSVVKNNLPAVKAYTSLGFKNYDDYLLVRYKQSVI
ncbi:MULTISPECIES: GNAT family N-acetyltransferase [Tissierellales]|uniref:GNAT family N-acetyltransferase n=1 Tax=Acidilutibacter cellobiosedens TaxID=2507161 RepID=A0A410QF48_9FIRM|nr:MULTISPECIES: GNAT family N-acetyltransferase [Tissierellales]MBE6082647.1 GNAT family N-acetyltransferase [Tissierellaceae bacterium]QAT62524.1 GNAT family N-acetyltransferase [Acidilutibacter cellobiosedens]